MAGKVLSQTCIKINNTFFDIVEKSFKVKKGYGTKENVVTIGEGGKIVRNVVTNTGEKIATGSFQILNTQENQTKLDALMDSDGLTIEALDINGNYKPITNASIMNDPEWTGSGDGVDIEFDGDAMEG